VTAQHRERGIARAATEQELEPRKVITAGRGLEPALEHRVVASAEDGAADPGIEAATQLQHAGGFGAWKQRAGVAPQRRCRAALLDCAPDVEEVGLDAVGQAVRVGVKFTAEQPPQPREFRAR